VSQLLSWQPAQLAASGQALLRRAGDLQRSAGELTSIGTGLAGVWSGEAAQAATAHHRRRSTEVDDLATVVHTAGRALIAAADAIGQARTSTQSALAAAAAAGCTVLDDGTVLPPPRPSMPGGLNDPDASAWRAQADATAAAQAATAARLTAQIRAALTAAGAADDTNAAALAALQPPLISPPPRPVQMGFTGGQWGPLPLPSCPITQSTSTSSPAQDDDDEDDGWWDGAVDQLVGFGTGVRDGVVEPVKMVGGLVGLNGDVTDNWSDLGSGIAHGVRNPTEFGKALIGWDDLSAGNYGHWAGELAPGVVAAFFTGGAAAGLKGADTAATTARAGQALRNVRTGIDDRLASGGLARDAGTLNPGAPFRPRTGTAGRTPQARQQGVEPQPWPDNVRRDMSFSGGPESYHRRVDGPGGSGDSGGDGGTPPGGGSGGGGGGGGGTPAGSGGTPPGDSNTPPRDSGSDGSAPPAGDGPGGFTQTPESMSERAAQYQAEVTGTPPGQSYVVDGVKFDGFADGSLLDAKGPGYEQFVDASSGSFKPWYRGADQLVQQAERQLLVAGDTPITWHVAEGRAATAIENLLAENGIGGIVVTWTPAAGS